MAAKNHTALAPAVIIDTGSGALLSDAAIRRKLRRAGVLVTLHREDGLPHGFMRARRNVLKATESFDHAIEGFLALAKN